MDLNQDLTLRAMSKGHNILNYIWTNNPEGGFVEMEKILAEVDENSALISIGEELIRTAHKRLAQLNEQLRRR